MTKQKIGLPKNNKYKYDCVLTAKMAPDRRFKCNTVIGIERTVELPKKTNESAQPQPPSQSMTQVNIQKRDV